MQICVDVIQDGWNVDVEGSRMFKLHKRVKHCRERLLEWRKKENTNSKIQIENIRGQMARMQDEGGQREWDSWYKLRTQLDEAYKADDEFWTRKSRVEWL